MKNLLIAIASLLFSVTALADPSPLVKTTEFYGASEQASQTNNVPERVSSQSYSTDVWFHSVELILSGDDNHNGFFHQLYLEFDADTNRSSQAVFAEFSLQRGSLAEQVFHTSSIFTLYGQSSDDWFAIDTTLEENYPKDYYTLIIRLYDASSGWLLAELSGYDIDVLADVPLEDYWRDQPHVTVIEQQGGSLGVFVILGLSLLVWQRKKTSIDSLKQAG